MSSDAVVAFINASQINARQKGNQLDEIQEQTVIVISFIARTGNRCYGYGGGAFSKRHCVEFAC